MSRVKINIIQGFKRKKKLTKGMSLKLNQVSMNYVVSGRKTKNRREYR